MEFEKDVIRKVTFKLIKLIKTSSPDRKLLYAISHNAVLIVATNKMVIPEITP